MSKRECAMYVQLTILYRKNFKQGNYVTVKLNEIKPYFHTHDKNNIKYICIYI